MNSPFNFSSIYNYILLFGSLAQNDAYDIVFLLLCTLSLVCFDSFTERMMPRATQAILSNLCSKYPRAGGW